MCINSGLCKLLIILYEKCEFSKPSVKFLGQILTRRVVVNPDKVKAIVEMGRPDDISGIRRFLDMVPFHSRLILSRRSSCSVCEDPHTSMSSM
jgi:hypothetical protein